MMKTQFDLSYFYSSSKVKKAIKSSKSTSDLKKVHKKLTYHTEYDENKQAILASMASKAIENRKNQKIGNAINTFAGLLLLVFVVMIIASNFIDLSYSPASSIKTVKFMGIELLNQHFQVTTHELGFVDGLKNGIVVFGKSISDILVNGVVEYIQGFKYSIIGNGIWLVFGWIWTFTKAFLLFIPKYFTSLVIVLIQPAKLGYYAGYVISTFITWVIAKAMDN